MRAWRGAAGDHLEAAPRGLAPGDALIEPPLPLLGQDGTVVLVRDTLDRGGPVLVFGPAVWAAFLAGLRSA